MVVVLLLSVRIELAGDDTARNLLTVELAAIVEG